MISYLLPLPVGNAVQITVGGIPSGTVHWRILRNLTGVFPAWNDPNSIVVADSNIGDPTQVIDSGPGLANGVLTYYLPFYYNGGTETWTADTGGAQSCTPATTYVDESIDALTIVLNRVTLGIAAEVARQALNPVAGVIQVMSAPPVFSEELQWPVISVHMDNETPLNRALGESIGNDEFNTITESWDDHEGWQAKTTISIVGWSLNADERILLRKAIRRIVLANFAVFDSAGLMQIEFSQADVEDFQSHNASIYETVGTFTCVTPLAVNTPQDPIDDVEVTVYPTFDGIVGPGVPPLATVEDLTDEFGNPLFTESGEPVALEI